MDTLTEQWAKTSLAPDHVEVSSFGRVRTLDRTTQSFRDGIPNKQTKRGKVLSPWVASHGYPTISIKVGKQRKKYLVHRLVAHAFCDGFKDGLTVNHKDGNKLNNNAHNLEWVTLARNTELQWHDGLVNLRGDNHPSKKINSNDVRLIRLLIDHGNSCNSISKLFGVSASLIYMIRDRKRWASV